ncbi:NUDIX domain-containing protein [Actinopolymorpha pittospori]|uniref:8-oxo-dGTP diphosphatase n=1 Tax=Actinopolymorpha pittospori TaxID=648752 RepID=A0A927NC38_9ACTN|nr:8-oxo-dGTP diphosphatase [Actinopolymorpha pittospori]
MARGQARHTRSVVEAAGAVVWRPSAHDRAEVLLVHRPKYDDWSFPKGKLLPGERAPVAAIREVAEETGIRIRLGPPLPTIRYPLTSGASKVVRYWSAVPAGGALEEADFVPNHEVDQRAWFRLTEAARQLTHARDRSLLPTLVPTPTRALVLLRHAGAIARAEWPGDDLDRPLTEDGTAQARRLVELLAAYGIGRVVSSPARRCVDTVLPYATAHGLEIELEPAFAEGVDPGLVREHGLRLLDSPEPVLLCGHRPTLPEVFGAVGVTSMPLQPAEVAVLHLSDRRSVAIERHPSGTTGNE